MKAMPMLPLCRVAAAATALLLAAGCGKKETARAEPPKPATVATPETPAAAPAAPTPVAPVTAPAASAKKPGPPPAAAVFVRAGPLARARRLADFLGTLRPGEVGLKLTLRTGETWVIRHPVGGIALANLPRLARTSWLHLETPTGGVLVPFAVLQSMTLSPISKEKEIARARLVLQDGSELAGVVRGQLGGDCELGRFEVPWRALQTVEITGREQAGPAEALPLAGGGAARLEDGTRLEFTAWAPVVGDVVSDMLLTEAGTGPEFVPLGQTGTVEFSGTDANAFFFQHAVTLTDRGQTTTVRRNTALTCVLLQQTDGRVVCLVPAVLQSITRP